MCHQNDQTGRSIGLMIYSPAKQKPCRRKAMFSTAWTFHPHPPGGNPHTFKIVLPRLWGVGSKVQILENKPWPHLFLNRSVAVAVFIQTLRLRKTKPACIQCLKTAQHEVSYFCILFNLLNWDSAFSPPSHIRTWRDRQINVLKGPESWVRIWSPGFVLSHTAIS